VARTGNALAVVYTCAAPGELFPDWSSVFGNANPLELEIGPGHGGFALDHAALLADRNLICVEHRKSDCELIRSRAAKRGLANLHVIHGDAKLLVPWMFRPGELGALHIQFPDPWWKTRHHKRRMIDAELARLFRTLLAPDGIVDFRTDVPAYFREAHQTWLEAGYVQLPDQPPQVLSTRERRYAQTGQPVYRARYSNSTLPISELSDRTGRDWRDVRRK
jgi:tRNA (guanine-N7-)-methyltransferase